jgi:tetratricopeptide (TPR) repeat protein
VRDQGDFTRAAALQQESLLLFEGLGDESGIAWTLSLLALALRPQGDESRALALLDESLALFEDQGDRRGIAWSFLQLGLVARDHGDHGRAGSLFKESLSRFRDLGDKYGIAQLVGELAAVACAQGQTERAARLFGAADALFAAIGARLSPPEQAAHERSLAALRARLSDTAFAAVWAQGQVMTAEQAVAEALQMTESTPWAGGLGRVGRLRRLAPSGSTLAQARIERVAHHVAEQVEAEHRAENGQARKRDEPGGSGDVGPPTHDHGAPLW